MVAVLMLPGGISIRWILVSARIAGEHARARAHTHTHKERGTDSDREEQSENITMN